MRFVISFGNGKSRHDPTGRMGPVPARSSYPDTPAAVRAVIHTFGSAARTEILHVLAQAGELTTAEVANRTEISESAALRHLRALAENGLVEEIQQPGVARGGIRLMWRANPSQVREYTAQWLRYATGEA
jgi:DNA-binding transcriptional ArsR family regulator